MMQAPKGANYATSFSVDHSPEATFAAITNVRGWWSEDIDGDTDRAGAEFTYRNHDIHRCTIRVTELVPAKKVSWLVLDNYFNFVSDESEWKGTEILFELSKKDGGTEVRFTHLGLTPDYECYDTCSVAWQSYVDGSLRDLITTGQGRPNPAESSKVVAR